MKECRAIKGADLNECLLDLFYYAIKRKSAILHFIFSWAFDEWSVVLLHRGTRRSTEGHRETVGVKDNFRESDNISFPTSC